MGKDADLTESQRAAVEHFEGPLLVVAGPGSGKTRVITRRIARLIDRGVHPHEILAITFTNKAARVMSERVQALLPRSFVWVSTFHKFCSRLLREHAAVVGLRPSFSIYDTSDQLTLLKTVLHDLNFDATHFPPGKLLGRISKAKNDLITADQFRQKHAASIGTHLDAVAARVYPVYQQRLLDANAVDFDDLLMHVARMLHEHDELRMSLDERYRFILVDEYQDTNRAQYQIVAALSQQFPNLCVTGDPDQSIYGWRGAQIENILRFERDFPGVVQVRLEENFRSTPEILAAADELIRHNVNRKPKRLQPMRESGQPVQLRLYADGQSEASSIAAEIQSLVQAGQRGWNDFAIFYRVNSLSRTVETALSRLKIPYQVAGGLAFYERAEIKDVLGYLRLIENPLDRIAFLRVVNTPTRGVGKSSLDRFVQWADTAGIDLLTAAAQSERVPNLSKKAAVGLRAFAALIAELADLSANPFGNQFGSTEFDFESDNSDDSDQSESSRGAVETIVRAVLERTGYYRQYEGPLDEDEVQRKSNVDELVSSAMLFDRHMTEQEEVATLGSFLETASLTQDVDSLEEETGAVTLMTLHAAKGLEFPDVYLIGVEQNLIPHERSLRENDKQPLEEERRLLFVGITRAQERLVLTHTERREMHGRTLSTISSDFLQELIVERRDCTGAGVTMEMWDQDIIHDDGFEESSTAPAQSSDWYGGTYKSQASPKKPKKTPRKPHLTTGAALEAGASTFADIPVGFGLGSQVRHPRYGIGTVVEVNGFSRMRTVTVEFAADHRRESFIAAKCPLQPVGFS
ncbi:ATP-dependent helicase [Schlesneria paludicola]|uniref:ATP-dependent helicase n=1 Tax=Schlesneria paludicola TaxID=360056 RepID=UPI00029B36A7|nr:UvrD-helicase domain-containing protein [Schlesneria paludicola]